MSDTPPLSEAHSESVERVCALMQAAENKDFTGARILLEGLDPAEIQWLVATFAGTLAFYAKELDAELIGSTDGWLDRLFAYMRSCVR